jgi:ribonucleoside-diphosphate reductase alpha chain
MPAKGKKLQPRTFDIDPVHQKIDPFDVPLIKDVWKDKYAWEGENTFEDMFMRVANGIYKYDTGGNEIHKVEAFRAMSAGLLMPGGRILAGAGTTKRVTLMNCYVNGSVGDSMEGIHEALGNVMFTLQQGGGIGTDFSTLRPKGARLHRTGKGAAASGPLPFMDQWDATSKTIKSAGNRRGAMMGTISDTHPDLPDFIRGKQGNLNRRWEQFNVSVLVSDAFIQAVELDDDWYLYFHAEPSFERPEELASLDFDDNTGVRQYVYSKWKARELWDMITRNTYEFSEPGVIFIDRVNDLNNLKYCEEIRCTNPCGEQPLPPHGTCNLAAVNLARMVRNPFTEYAEFDFSLLEDVVSVGIRFLDNVIDVTNYPLPQQETEEKNKRRLGLGISGLADCLAQLGIRYGSAKSVRMVENIMRCLANTAYRTSALLAHERGVFPLYNKDEILNAPFVQKLDKEVRGTIESLGLRNGVLLTIAPTGTTSLVFGNISSGLECTFLHEVNRRVFGPDGQWKEYGMVPAYGYRLYKAVHGEVPVSELPDYMVTMKDLSVDDHLRIQAACQKWIDASVSKTINVPEDTPFEEFQELYMKAYRMGCKGCTTYRPNANMDAVLSDPNSSSGGGEKSKQLHAPAKEPIRARAEALDGTTYKIKWPSWSSSVYVTINHDAGGNPFEIFIQSKDARHQEWITALTIMISACMRRGGDITFIPAELKQVHSTHDSAWVNGKFYGSLVHRIGDVIEQHFIRVGLMAAQEPIIPAKNKGEPLPESKVKGEICPACHAPTFFREEGCRRCYSCGYTTCG